MVCIKVKGQKVPNFLEYLQGEDFIVDMPELFDIYKALACELARYGTGAPYVDCEDMIAYSIYSTITDSTADDFEEIINTWHMFTNDEYQQIERYLMMGGM